MESWIMRWQMCVMCELKQKKKKNEESNPLRGTYGQLMWEGAFSQMVWVVSAKANRPVWCSSCRWSCSVWTELTALTARLGSGEHNSGGVYALRGEGGRKKHTHTESLGNITPARSFLTAPKTAFSYWTGGKRWAQKHEATLAHYAPVHTHWLDTQACVVTKICFYKPCVTLVWFL